MRTCLSRASLAAVLLSLAAAPAVASANRASATVASAAVERAARWLAVFPVEGLHYDAAVGLAAIRRKVDGEALRIAFERARSVADRDADNPMRRFFDESYRAPAKSTSRWEVPGPGQPRVNVNRVLEEALHCADNGLRPETRTYVTGPMRDGGGYHTTHAVWALVLAREAGCISKREFTRLARPLRDELRAAEPPRPAGGALAVDLFAERLLMLMLTGVRGAPIDAWAAALIEAQGADGGFGTLAPDENPYHRYHATLMSTWALAEWAPR